MDTLTREMNALKPTIRKMLMYSQDVEETKKRILLIYFLVALGVAYHFEDEIDDNLKHGFEKIETIMAGEIDLSTVSVMFWVFRTYGYNVSSSKEYQARLFINVQ